MARKFNKESVDDACYEGKSYDGNLILVKDYGLEGEIMLNDYGTGYDVKNVTNEFILKAKDDKKFYSHVMFWYVERLEEDEEIELTEVKKKRKSITVWVDVED